VADLKHLSPPIGSESVASDEVLDEALARLGQFGPEFGGGLSSHGPMVAEALVRLGRGDAVSSWVDGYVGRLEPPVAPSGRQPELGAMATIGDWELRFAGQLAEAPWDDVVRSWVPRLAPGLMAAATHGWLRTAHAVRSLRSRQSPERLAELARALAYWAGRYQEVPGPVTPHGALTVAAGVAALPSRRPAVDGLIFEAVRVTLDGDDEFATAVDAVDARKVDVDGLLAAAASEVLARGATDPVVYVHTLTPTAAIRPVADLLDPTDRERVLGSTWRTIAALVSTYRLPPADPVIEPADVDADDVVDRAVASGDEHAIKVAEAAFGPAVPADPTVRAAASVLVSRLSG
jgi:hypothetical protein